MNNVVCIYFNLIQLKMHLLAGQTKFKHHNTYKIHKVVMAIRTEHLHVLYALKMLTIIKLFKIKNTEEHQCKQL